MEIPYYGTLLINGKEKTFSDKERKAIEKYGSRLIFTVTKNRLSKEKRTDLKTGQTSEKIVAPNNTGILTEYSTMLPENVIDSGSNSTKLIQAKVRIYTSIREHPENPRLSIYEPINFFIPKVGHIEVATTDYNLAFFMLNNPALLGGERQKGEVIFELYKEHAAAHTASSLIKIKKQMLLLIEAASDTELKAIATSIHNANPAPFQHNFYQVSEMEVEDIRAELQVLADAYPATFQVFVREEKIEGKVFRAKLLEAGILNEGLNITRYKDASTQAFLPLFNHTSGKNPEECFELWFNNPSNAGKVKALTDSLAERNKVTV